MKQSITILVATMSGTAEMVAEEIANRIEDAGAQVTIMRMENAGVATIAQATSPVLVCSSTYGTGDVPDNGMALYTALQQERPDLSRLRYGVVALGDGIYPQTFCFGGRKFDELFTELGAVRIGTRFQHDASSGIYPDEAAGDWAEQWLEELDA